MAVINITNARKELYNLIENFDDAQVVDNDVDY